MGDLSFFPREKEPAAKVPPVRKERRIRFGCQGGSYGHKSALFRSRLKKVAAEAGGRIFSKD